MEMAELTVSDLTIDELRGLIREVVVETIAELLGDPDADLELSEEFKTELLYSLGQRQTHRQESVAMEDVARDLGLEW